VLDAKNWFDGWEAEKRIRGAAAMVRLLRRKPPGAPDTAGLFEQSTATGRRLYGNSAAPPGPGDSLPKAGEPKFDWWAFTRCSVVREQKRPKSLQDQS